ncbi:hypothetical protein Acr_00g0079270 [Actinidia rufa]|uniref:BED-type domain-containing protein n=1 Tax=Actinidia rufa TaxID=165716 RepID=A0A7J0DTX0_9ERIC|nr:hypothetical protein Acr_00g0079270 [Actinidia rufa]
MNRAVRKRLEARLGSQPTPFRTEIGAREPNPPTLTSHSLRLTIRPPANHHRSTTGLPPFECLYKTTTDPRPPPHRSTIILLPPSDHRNTIEDLQYHLRDNDNDNGNGNGNETVEVEGNPFQKKGRKKTSKVWNEMKEVVLPDGTKKVECTWCKTKFAIHSTGVTTQLKRHLDRCLRRKIAIGGTKQKILSIESTGSDSAINVSSFTYDHAKVREVASHMILYHEMTSVGSKIYHPEAEANKNIAIVREALYELYYEYVSVHTSVNSEQLKTRETCSSSTLPNEKSIVTGRSKFESFVRKADTIQPMKSDLDIYLEESVYICDEGWLQNSESTFSAGGRVIDPYRASLSTETVQILLCGADWVRAFYGIKKGSEAEETSFKEIWLP